MKMKKNLEYKLIVKLRDGDLTAYLEDHRGYRVLDNDLVIEMFDLVLMENENIHEFFRRMEQS